MTVVSDKDIERIYSELIKRTSHIGSALLRSRRSIITTPKGPYVLSVYDTPTISEAEYAFYSWNCAILTAFRGSDTLSPEDNFKRNIERNNNLRSDLTQAGLLFRPVDGCYKEAGWESPSVELCFFVTLTDSIGSESYSEESRRAFFARIYRLAEKYEQDSFLYTFPGINRVAFLVATNDGGRAEFRGDHKFAGPLFTHVQALNAWTDCKDGRISFRLKGMIMEGGLGSKKLRIGEGDIFDVEGYHPDGIGIIRNKTQKDLKDACRDFDRSVPLVERFFAKEILTADDVRSKVRENLNALKNEGCKRIGFHCSASINGSYEDGARIAIETVKEWASRNDKKFDWIALVDIYGDYSKVK